jgi:predicted nucleic acid-binding protein
VKLIYADTLYWVAVARPGDPYRDRALAARAKFSNSMILTSDEVLTEFLNALSGGGPGLRSMAVNMVKAIMNDVNTHVVPQTRDTFIRALELYGQRLDKGYSLVDCSSMVIMRNQGIIEVLTQDRHFYQEGFNVLIQ